MRLFACVLGFGLLYTLLFKFCLLLAICLVLMVSLLVAYCLAFCLGCGLLWLLCLVLFLGFVFCKNIGYD